MHLAEGADGSKSGSTSASKAQRFGNYELIRRLAAGGMAEIFLAKQTGLSGFERLLVIKKILPHLAENKEFITMFLDEARIAAQLTHPNVVQIYDLGRIPIDTMGRSQDAYYIAMEYIHGEDIRRIYNQEVQREARIPVEYAAHIISQAAAGLDHAHRKVDINGQALGLVHRDVSPQNLLVTYDGHIKVVDFGVAKAANKMAQTRSGVLKGKYSYMSPEQAQGMKIDHRTDIFALAIVLYEVTCGVRLFKRENELETLHAVIACDVTPPSKIDPGYPPQLEAIVMKALAKNPARRHQNAGELARELDEFCQDMNRTLTARDVASYMQDLFADKLAEELLMGQSMWEEEHTDDRRKAAQRAERSPGGTELVEEAAEEHTRNDRVGSKQSQPNAHDLADDSVLDPMLREKSDSGGWSKKSNRTEQDEFDMSRSTDAATAAAPVQMDMPKTVAAAPVQLLREDLGGGDRSRTILTLAIAAAALIAIFAMVVGGVFDGGDRSGPVFFDSRPSGATIYLDGIRVTEGRTPLELTRPIALGEHHVKYQLEGHEPAEGKLKVAAKERNTIELDLKAIAPPPTELPSPTAEKKTTAADAPPPMASTKKTGTLTVRSKLPLRVYEGKTLLGTTPLTKALSAGRHSVKLVHETSGWSETRMVDVGADGAAKLDVGSGTLRVNILPFGNVRIGSFTAETPIAPVELPAGTHSVKVWNSELNKKETVTVRVTEGREAPLNKDWR